MKVKLLAIVLICSLLVGFVIPVLAESGISPYADITTTLYMGLNINGSTVEAYARCSPPSPRVAAVSVRIEKYLNGKWSVVARSADMTQTSTSCSYVSGAKYRAYATCTVYENGNEVDSASKYSAVKP